MWKFLERHSFRIVSGESRETMWKLCLSAKFPHQETRWNFGILPSVSYIRFLFKLPCVGWGKKNVGWKIVLKQAFIQHNFSSSNIIFSFSQIWKMLKPSQDFIQLAIISVFHEILDSFAPALKFKNWRSSISVFKNVIRLMRWKQHKDWQQ